VMEDERVRVRVLAGDTDWLTDHDSVAVGVTQPLGVVSPALAPVPAGHEYGLHTPTFSDDALQNLVTGHSTGEAAPAGQ